MEKIKTYSVKFDCLMPCEITTVIKAKNMEEATDKIMENDFENFRYKTKGKMYNMKDIKLKELNI